MNLIVVNESKLARRTVPSKLPLIQASVRGCWAALCWAVLGWAVLCWAGLGALGRWGLVKAAEGGHAASGAATHPPQPLLCPPAAAHGGTPPAPVPLRLPPPTTASVCVFCMLCVCMQLVLRYQDVDLVQTIEERITRELPGPGARGEGPRGTGYRGKGERPAGLCGPTCAPVHVLQRCCCRRALGAARRKPWLPRRRCPAGPAPLTRAHSHRCTAITPRRRAGYLASHPLVDTTISARCSLQEFTPAGPRLSFRVRWLAPGSAVAGQGDELVMRPGVTLAQRTPATLRPTAACAAP